MSGMKDYFIECEVIDRLYHAEKLGVCTDCGYKINVKINDDKSVIIIRCDNCSMFWELRKCPGKNRYTVFECRWGGKK